ncbi:DUF397 domain-containing protein [Streptomyces venezuelae]|uniref:DUF397 domain-containing protein n=1 Tax=Streptomyces venezuelae TaxID=54571 RepID=A0A5P2CIW5_STRVZ|nr:DUF397 domain-containing protein [Streptomyces venezuelae]QES42796.1 DUF397 domain-containing protein [Streptomyces venezuelae]
MPPWQKSSFSAPGDGNECIELAKVEHGLLLRESDTPDRRLALTSDTLGALLRQIQKP